MRRIAFFAVAGLVAALAGIMVHSALRKKESELEKARLQTTDIVVAAHDLPLGTKLQAADVRVIRWPQEHTPADSTSDPAAVLGRIVKSAMVENEPIVASRLYSGETAGILPLIVPPDMRAMSVAVDEVSDIAGFVLPHARVDVLVSIREQGAGLQAPAKAKIVLENVEVLAVAQETDRKDKPQVEKVVTLLVTPAEAERLALASQEGALRLAMRNYNDDKIVLTEGSSVATLLASYGGSASYRPPVGQARRVWMPAPRPPAPRVKVEVMRDGTSRDALSFGADGREIRPVSDAPRLPMRPPYAPPYGPPAAAPPAVAPPAELPPAPVPPATASAGKIAATPAPTDMVAFEGPDAKVIETH